MPVTPSRIAPAEHGVPLELGATSTTPTSAAQAHGVRAQFTIFRLIYSTDTHPTGAAAHAPGRLPKSGRQPRSPAAWASRTRPIMVHRAPLAGAGSAFQPAAPSSSWFVRRLPDCEIAVQVQR